MDKKRTGYFSMYWTGVDDDEGLCWTWIEVDKMRTGCGQDGQDGSCPVSREKGFWKMSCSQKYF